ncbi:MAG: hypothetical protein R2932_55405 [Caldilineaceae bacterium]
MDFGFIPKPQADLVIVKCDALDPMVAGTALTYTIVLTNNGPQAAQRHCHRYLTSGHNAPIGHASGGAGCTLAGNQVICNVGTIGAGYTVTITVTVLVDPTMTTAPQRPTVTTYLLCPWFTIRRRIALGSNGKECQK